jgi:arginyl-tRNA synthetase
MHSKFCSQLKDLAKINSEQVKVTAGLVWGASQLREEAEQKAKTEYPECKTEALRLKGIADQIAASIPSYQQAADAARADTEFRAQEATSAAEEA